MSLIDPLYDFPSASVSLAGKAIVVTGAAGDIGSAISRRLADAGAILFLIDAAELALAELVSSLSQLHSVRGLRADVTRSDEVEAALREIRDQAHTIHVVINNAGVALPHPLLDHDLESWRTTFAVNVEGPLLVSQMAVRVMRDQPIEHGCRGKIINISSPASLRAHPYMAAYGASKAALNSLTKSMAMTFAPHAISTTAVFPGPVESHLSAHLIYKMAEFSGRPVEELVGEMLAYTIPPLRFQNPQDVADSVFFVAAAPGMGLNGRLVWSAPFVQEI